MWRLKSVYVDYIIFLPKAMFCAHNVEIKLRPLVLKLVFRCSYSYNLINQGQTLHSDSVRLPPISRQSAYISALCMMHVIANNRFSI